MIKAILWDVDGTLLDFPAAEKAAIEKCFEVFSLGNCTDEMLADYSIINSRYWKMLENGEMTKPEILVGRFREFFGKYSLDVSCAEAFNEEYQMRLGDTVVFYETALQTVNALKGKVLQCAVTNGTKVAQDRKLKNSGLDKLFDYIFISDVLGVEKPNKAFFDKVFDVIGKFSPNEVMIVGDSVTSDIRGGKNAGIITCLFDPSGTKSTGEIKPDYTVNRISDVLDVLAQRRFDITFADASCRKSIEELCSKSMFDGSENICADDYYFSGGENRILAAFEENKIVGCVMAECYRDWGDIGSVLFLYNLCVDELFRGRGIAQALVRSAVLYAKELKVRRVYADIDISTPVPERVFTKAGFALEEGDTNRYFKAIFE